MNEISLQISKRSNGGLSRSFLTCSLLRADGEVSFHLESLLVVSTGLLLSVLLVLSSVCTAIGAYYWLTDPSIGQVSAFDLWGVLEE